MTGPPDPLTFSPEEVEGSLPARFARVVAARGAALAVVPHLEVEVVPGDHHACVTRHVGAFAARLEARLQSLE